MGTFGTALFSDDLACDIRDDFKELIGDGKSPQEATDMLLTVYAESIADPDEATVFWLALAAIQWQTGRLLDDVRDQALSVIESGADLDRWCEAASKKELAKRKEILAKLKVQLLSPQPPAKKLPKVYKENTPFEVGDVFSYRHSTGKYALFRVMEHLTDRGGRHAICEILEYFSSEEPTNETLLRPLPYTKSDMTDFRGKLISRFMLGEVSSRYLPKERARLIARKVSTTQNASMPFVVVLWREVDDFLLNLFANKSFNCS